MMDWMTDRVDGISEQARDIFDLVIEERLAQEKKWGMQNHDPFCWMAILTEEMGELSETMLKMRFGNSGGVGMHEEAVQVAAVAIAFLECISRGDWWWGRNDKTDSAEGSTVNTAHVSDVRLAIEGEIYDPATGEHWDKAAINIAAEAISGAYVRNMAGRDSLWFNVVEARPLVKFADQKGDN